MVESEQVMCWYRVLGRARAKIKELREGEGEQGGKERVRGELGYTWDE